MNALCIAILLQKFLAWLSTDIPCAEHIWMAVILHYAATVTFPCIWYAYTLTRGSQVDAPEHLAGLFCLALSPVYGTLATWMHLFSLQLLNQLLENCMVHVAYDVLVVVVSGSVGYFLGLFLFIIGALCFWRIRSLFRGLMYHWLVVQFISSGSSSVRIVYRYGSALLLITSV